MENTVKTYVTDRGDIKLYVNGFYYDKFGENGSKDYWVCELHRNNNCNARVTTTMNAELKHEILSKHMPNHNHESNYNQPITMPPLHTAESEWDQAGLALVDPEPNALREKSQETQDVDSSSLFWVDQELQSGNMDEINPDPLVPQINDDYDTATLDEQPSKVKIERRSSSLYYKKIKTKKLKHRVTSRKYSTDSSTQSAKEDEFDIYGKYIASQLRNMDLPIALRIQLAIQNLVNEARISDIVPI